MTENKNFRFFAPAESPRGGSTLSKNEFDLIPKAQLAQDSVSNNDTQKITQNPPAVQIFWGTFEWRGKTGKTSDMLEAQRNLQARNEAEVQPDFNRSLVRVYLNPTDPKLATRMWQEVMEPIVARKIPVHKRGFGLAGSE